MLFQGEDNDEGVVDDEHDYGFLRFTSIVPPFMVFGLPRSCTAWFSTLLSLGSRTCFHEVETTCNSFDEFFNKIEGQGNSSTVAWTLLPQLIQRWPNLRFVWLQKDPSSCEHSLQNLGVYNMSRLDLESASLAAERAGAKNQIVVDANSLDIGTAETVWRHLIPDEPFPIIKAKNLLRMNVRLLDTEFEDVSTRQIPWLMEALA